MNWRPFALRVFVAPVLLCFINLFSWTLRQIGDNQSNINLNSKLQEFSVKDVDSEENVATFINSSVMHSGETRQSAETRSKANGTNTNHVCALRFDNKDPRRKCQGRI